MSDGPVLAVLYLSADLGQTRNCGGSASRISALRSATITTSSFVLVPSEVGTPAETIT